jgi:GDP-mannose 4,6 dehydratase
MSFNSPVLVTGGAGFIGSNFVLQWLAEQPAAITVLDKLTYAGNMESLATVEFDSRYRFVCGDIADGALVRSILDEQRPGAIVHLAAESHVDRSILEPGKFIRTNIDGTFQLLEAALAYWSDLPAKQRSAFRFLHVSTDEVYGSLSSTAPAFTEETPYAPNRPYSASKAASDHSTYGVLDQGTAPPAVAFWSINEDVFAGNARTVVDSGTSPATSTPTGRAAFELTEYTVQVTGLSVTLTPGTYWLSVVPICTNAADPYCSGIFFTTDVEYINTASVNAYGPAEPIDAAYFDSPTFGSSFEPTYRPVGACGGDGCDAFSAGVLGKVKKK